MPWEKKVDVTVLGESGSSMLSRTRELQQWYVTLAPPHSHPPAALGESAGSNFWRWCMAHAHATRSRTGVNRRRCTRRHARVCPCGAPLCRFCEMGAALGAVPCWSGLGTREGDWQAPSGLAYNTPHAAGALVRYSEGGVMIVGFDMYRNLSAGRRLEAQQKLQVQPHRAQATVFL